MTENIQKEDILTKERIIAGLHALGVREGMLVEVHASLSSMGWVLGGARTVVDAILELIGEEGTILMPVHTTDNSEPSSWVNPPAEPSAWQMIRSEMPAYDPEHSDLKEMGAVAENLIRREGTVISNHPTLSYAAKGRYASLLCNRQSMHFPLAEESPAARLYELRGSVLLLGTGFDKCTCLHLAEYRTESRPIIMEGASIRTEEGTRWKKYLNLDLDAEFFPAVEEIMRKKGMISETMIGSCHAMLFSASQAVDEATQYLSQTSVFGVYR